ncbi:MAG: SpoVA/SpoVAEb family sporulation membrane protein [Firmicutes bacterium]|nr:SpoVA/SpoVAEb family sporulation membrane protein [Bacillota bacterium]
MEIFLSFLYTFLAGGVIVLLAQILIVKTKITPARILVGLLVLGAILEAVTAFKYLEDFFGSGVTIPIVGFGAVLARGAIEGARATGFLGVLTGPLTAASAGLSVAIVSAFFMALIFKARTKNLK